MTGGVVPIDLRAGSIADLAIIDMIMRDAFDPRYGEAWTASQCAGVMALPGVWLTIAAVDGIPAGFAMIRAIVDESELLLLAVRPAARRRGVGRALLRAAIGESQRRGMARIHLEVREGNGAIVMYRDAGFERIGRRRDYYRGNNGKLLDALTFQKVID
jgi:ribosomal-protein-alanine N-acetyltransferase